MVVSFFIVSTTQAQTFDLKQYRWENRLLVVFAKDQTSPAFQVLKKEIEKQKESFEDRDMVFIRVFENGQSLAGKQHISKKRADYLRERFEVHTGAYRVFLIGKDGGIKREGGAEIRARAIYDLIDTMPMRRNEMRRKSSTN